MRRKLSRGIRARSGFTLVEGMAAMMIYGVVVVIALGTYLTALHHRRHTEDSLESAAGIRQATDLVSKMVRSAALEPEVSNAGRVLRVVPNDAFFVSVAGGTVIDPLKIPAINGVPEGQPTVTLAPTVRQPATLWALRGACPDTAVSSPGSLFVDASMLPVVDLDDLFTVGDTVTIPGTGYGSAGTYVIEAIGNSAGSKWLRFDSDLSSPLPNGTQIAATSARQVRFSIEDNGDLRYYRDERNLNQFAVIASNICAAPIEDPLDASAGTSEPFIYDADKRVVLINLQCRPAGSLAGRTTLDARTEVRIRSNPLSH